MSQDGMLHARIDPMWMSVLLRARGVRYDTLRTLAEAWGEDRQRVIEALDQLAAVVDEGGPAWDAAVEDVEADLQFGEAEVELTHLDAYRLSDELLAAAELTMSARREAAIAPEVIAFPHQHQHQRGEVA